MIPAATMAHRSGFRPRGRAVWGAILAAILAAAAADCPAGVDLAIQPAAIAVLPGEVFEVTLTVTRAGTAFNGYDAVVGYDPAALTFIPRPQTAQEGALMTAACPNRYHVLDVEASSGRLDVEHVLLCAGASVAGPGVVYRLLFRAGDVAAATAIRLLPGTSFFAAGLYVNPVQLQDAEVRIQGPSPVPGDPPTAAPRLRAAPNPFNAATVISFEAAPAERARLAVFTTRGELVTVLRDGPSGAGPQIRVWDGRDACGRLVGSGVYLVRLELGGDVLVREVTMAK